VAIAEPIVRAGLIDAPVDGLLIRLKNRNNLEKKSESLIPQDSSLRKLFPSHSICIYPARRAFIIIVAPTVCYQLFHLKHSHSSETTDRGTRNREQGTAFGMNFYTAGTEMFHVPVPRMAFPKGGAFHVPGDYDLKTVLRISLIYYMQLKKRKRKSMVEPKENLLHGDQLQER